MYTPAPATLDADFDSSAYGLIDLGEASPDKCRERWVFVWVIIQALVDIGMIQPITSGRRAAVNHAKPHVRAAMNWLLHDTKDFFLVREMAGIEPFIIRTEARKFMSRMRTA